MKTNKEAESTKLSRKSLGLIAPTPVIVLTGWNRPKHLSTSTKEEFTEKNYYSTVEPACPRPSTHYHKELLANTSKMQYYETIQTIQTSEWCHSDQMPINNYIRSPMRHCRLTTQGMHLSLT